MPTHVVFLSLIYPIAGLVIGGATFGYNLLPLFYPMAAGFALLGPLTAIGLYELSRRREQGLDAQWSHAFDLLQADSFRAILALGLVLLALFGLVDRGGANDLRRRIRQRPAARTRSRRSRGRC